MEDYKYTEGGDLDFSSGDLEITESTQQHKFDLLLGDKGHFRNKPQAGVGVVNYLIDNNQEECFRAIRQEMAGDGMKVSRVAWEGKYLIVDAAYGNNSQ